MEWRWGFAEKIRMAPELAIMDRERRSLKDWIAERYASQAAFARAMGVSRQVVTLWLDGKANASESHRRLAALLMGIAREQVIWPGEEDGSEA